MAGLKRTSFKPVSSGTASAVTANSSLPDCRQYSGKNNYSQNAGFW
ncbi:MAG: hypothetical protein ACLQVW_06865 [Limisphaerales bacterium]